MKHPRVSGEGILARHGVAVQKGEYGQYGGGGGGRWPAARHGVSVVKAQIHAGGRGKGGGVKSRQEREEARETAAKIRACARDPSDRTVGSEGGPRVVEQGLKIKRELYLGLVIDASSERPVMMASPDGGVESREGCRKDTGSHLQRVINPASAARVQTRKLAFALGLDGPQVAQAGKLMNAGWQAFVETDALISRSIR